MKISLLTGGDDPTYALPLLSSLTARGIEVDFIGNDEMLNDPAAKHEKVRYLNLRGDQDPNAAFFVKIKRLTRYYFKLMRYAAATDSPIFHILWLNKFTYFDRTLLNLYYKLFGKKLVFTAHNINDRERDNKDSLLNRLSLRFMYNVVDHIFVHTQKMKQQLVDEFGINTNKITVIPFGINNQVPNTGLTCSQARERLGIDSGWQVMLFFGRIARYKGLDQLIAAFDELKKTGSSVRLLIAGDVKAGNDSYWSEIQKSIDVSQVREHIIERIEFIPDADVELYCKASDVLILPYRHIFQTGVLFLSYYFGLPAIATDVGSLREDIVEGETGFVCRPGDPKDLAETIDRYFKSDIYKNLEKKRQVIREYALDKYSWGKVAELTSAVYGKLS